MEAPPAIVLSEDEELIRQIREGKAIFSTNYNRIPKREAKPGEASIIMRSDPLADVDALVESLQEQFPQVCKNITAPIQNIYEYFDHYDVQLHGTGIVHSVLNKIAESNTTRGMRILSFTEYWKNAHSRRFYNINEHTRELFTEEEFKEYGKDFLQDAFIRLKELRRMMVPLVPEVFSASPYPSLATTTGPIHPIPFALPPPEKAQNKSNDLGPDPNRRHNSYPFYPKKQQHLHAGQPLERRARSDNGPPGIHGITVLPMHATPHFEPVFHGRSQGLSSSYRRNLPILLTGPTQSVDPTPNVLSGCTGLFPCHYHMGQPMQPGHPMAMVNMPNQESGGRAVAVTSDGLPLTPYFHHPGFDHAQPYNQTVMTGNISSLHGQQQDSNQLVNPKSRIRQDHGPAMTLAESGGRTLSNVRPPWVSDDARRQSGTANQEYSNDARTPEYQDAPHRPLNGNRRLSEVRGSQGDPHNRYSLYESRQNSFKGRGSESRSSWKQATLPDSERPYANHQKKLTDFSKEQQRRSTYVENPTIDEEKGYVESERRLETNIPPHLYQGQFPGDAHFPSQHSGPSTTIYVGGSDVSAECIRQIFEPIGRILEVVGPKLSSRTPGSRRVPYYFGFVKFAYPKDAARAVAEWDGVRTPSGTVLTVNLRNTYSQSANFDRGTEDVFAHHKSMTFDHVVQPYRRFQPDTGRDNWAGRSEQMNRSAAPLTPTQTETSFTSQNNSRHVSPKKNKKNKKKKTESQSTSKTTPSRKDSLAAPEVSLPQVKTYSQNTAWYRTDHDHSGPKRPSTTDQDQQEVPQKASRVQTEEQAQRIYSGRYDTRVSRSRSQNGLNKDESTNNTYNPQLPSDGSPKKIIRKPNSNLMIERSHASSSGTTKEGTTNLPQVAPVGEASSKEPLPLSQEEWPSLSEFSVRVASPEHYSPTKPVHASNPERSSMDECSLEQTGSKIPKTPREETIAEANIQSQGGDDKILQSSFSLAGNERDGEMTAVKCKTVKMESGILTTEAKTLNGPTQGDGEYPPDAHFSPTVAKTFDGLAEGNGEYSHNASSSLIVAKIPQIVTAEPLENNFVRKPHAQFAEEGSGSTESIIAPLRETSTISDTNLGLEKDVIEGASSVSRSVKPATKEHKVSALTSEIMMKPEVKSVNAKGTDMASTPLALNLKMTAGTPEPPRETEVVRKARKNKSDLFVSTKSLDIADTRRRTNGHASLQASPLSSADLDSNPQLNSHLISKYKQPQEMSNQTSPPSAISTHMKRRNKRTPTRESFSRKAKTAKPQLEASSDKKLPAILEPKEGDQSHASPVEDTEPELELVSQDSNITIVENASEELTGPNRNYPQVNEAHAVENLYVPPKARSQQIWIVNLNTPKMEAQSYIPLLQLQSLAEHTIENSKKVEEIEEDEHCETVTTAISSTTTADEGLSCAVQAPSSDTEKKVEIAPQPALDAVAKQSLDTTKGKVLTSPPSVGEEQPSDPKKKKSKAKRRKKSRNTSITDLNVTPAVIKQDKTTNLMNSPTGLPTIDSDEMFPPLGASKPPSKKTNLRKAQPSVENASTVAKDPEISPSSKAKVIPGDLEPILLNPKVVQEDPTQDAAAKYNLRKHIQYTPKIRQEMQRRSADAQSDTSSATIGRVSTPAEPTIVSDSGTPTQLSEASMKQHQENLTVATDLMQPSQHRRGSSVTMSEISTASSRQRKLFSEIAINADRNGTPAARATSSSGGKDSEKEKRVTSVVEATAENGEQETSPVQTTNKGKGKEGVMSSSSSSKKKTVQDPWSIPDGEKPWGT